MIDFIDTAMHLVKHLFTVFLLASLTNTSLACDCLWQGSFIKSQQQADLVISGRIESIKGNAMDVDIDKVMRGKEFLPVIRVWGNTKNLCRPAVAEFPLNSEWVMALVKINTVPDSGFNPNTPNISYGRVDDYYLSSCGANWLAVNEGMVSGNLAEGTRWERNPKMNPVQLPLIEAFIQGILPAEALVEASKISPETRRLMNETSSFIRNQE